MTEGRIRVLCVDDHCLVREGITMLLSSQPDMEVVGCAGTGAQAAQLFKACRPDITLMDLRLPLMSGMQAIERILDYDDTARIIVLTMYSSSSDIQHAFRLGASAYVLKDTVTGELVRVIRQVYEGSYRWPEALHKVIGDADKSDLTGRELEIVRLLAEGKRNKEIASSLSITEETVHAHMKHIFAKFCVHDRTGALAVAYRRGLIDLR